ncbi:MAG TPA: indolepyruvate ferredoxin oxidoreductase family protein, partial [Rhizomicrobium sp.]
ANGLDRVMLAGGGKAKIGIVTSGKTYLDVRQALDELGIDEIQAAKLGIRLLKVAMSWPLEPSAIAKFAQDLDLILVVEEKRSLIETQIKEQLFDLAARPRVLGKKDEEGRWLFPAKGALDPLDIAAALGRRVLAISPDEALAARLAEVERLIAARPHDADLFPRIPYFCAGCPHNTSTVVPEGSIGLAGIGCHYMVTWQPQRNTALFTQMGGEGTPWIGASPFTTRPHVFSNMGDGTYFHSGLLAIRASVSAGVNITYKLLYNDAVAMTGGQHVDGELTVPEMAAQVTAEGIKKLIIVSDEPEKHSAADFPSGTRIEHRRDLDAIQKQLREIPGVTVMIYDQTCAAEKRRRRKRGLMVDPPKRAFINELVCEGCGDCSKTSNCVSVEPLETEFGRKRKINQSSCNKDFSCVEGFCPSFVTVHGGGLKTRAQGNSTDGAANAAFDIPQPVLPEVTKETFNIVIGGIGGTGVTSIGAILGTAAHMEGKTAATLDMMGLAQKGGAVTSFVRVAAPKGRIHGPRVPTAQADVLIGCDIVMSAKPDTFGYLSGERTVSIVNDGLTPTAAFVTDNTIDYDMAAMRARIARASRRIESIDAEELALRLLGDTIYANMFQTGYAYQL